ncbi:MAG: hypothetical protein ACI8QT_000398 [Halioglobus sp.]
MGVRHTTVLHFVGAALVVALAGCASNAPTINAGHIGGHAVCDSYIILSMCVEDMTGDNTVDIVYFTDTNEVFMYQEGRRDVVPEHMALHRCAVPLDEGMQDTTNRILQRDNLSFTEELDITRLLIANYAAAKPTIDACNAKFEGRVAGDIAAESEFSDFEQDWDAN